jgi:dynein heavy chain
LHQIIVRGRRKYINIADKNVELHDGFRAYFITRLPNPHFSPELQAKTTVVDFTVAMKGLEEQLLGRVIAKEQKALEDLLNKVLEEVNVNTKALMQLDALLLERLTANSGNLLDDEDLADVLANTKMKAAEVKGKLLAAGETRRNTNEKRELFRPVATRGVCRVWALRCVHARCLSWYVCVGGDVRMLTRGLGVCVVCASQAPCCTSPSSRCRW